MTGNTNARIRAAYAALRLRTGETLLAVATAVAREHRSRLGVQNPPPDYLESSRPGEYPRRRTGRGQRSVTVEPAIAEEAGERGYVDVGHEQDAWYMQWLADRAQRRGLADTLADMRGELERIAGHARLTAAAGRA